MGNTRMVVDNFVEGHEPSWILRGKTFPRGIVSVVKVRHLRASK